MNTLSARKSIIAISQGRGLQAPLVYHRRHRHNPSLLLPLYSSFHSPASRSHAFTIKMAPSRRPAPTNSPKTHSTPHRLARPRASLSIEPIPSEDVKHCRSCNSNSSTYWRTGPDGPSTLCNRCGQRLRANQIPIYISVNGKISASPTLGARLATVTGAQPHPRSPNRKDWSRLKVLPVKPEVRCLACNRERVPHLLAGPDGPRTICKLCYTRFHRKKLPLFQMPDGKVTVVETEAAKKVRHVGFEARPRTSALPRRSNNPRVEALEEHHAPSDMQLPETSAHVKNVLAGNGVASNAVIAVIKRQRNSQDNGEARGDARCEENGANESAIHDGDGGEDTTVGDDINENNVLERQVNNTDEEAVQEEPVCLEEEVKSEPQPEPHPEIQPRSSSSHEPQSPTDPELRAHKDSIVTSRGSADEEHGNQYPVAEGRVQKSLRGSCGSPRPILVKARYCRSSDSRWVTRRFPLRKKLSFAALHAHLTEMFEAERAFSILYQDNEGDDVTVSSDLEMTELYRVCNEHELRPIRMTLM